MSDLSLLFASSLPIEVKPSIPKFLLMLFVLTGVTVFLVWTLIHDPAHGAWPVIPFASGTSLGALACIYVLCDRRPLVLLNEQGITVRGWKGCPVAWGEVESVWKFEQQIPTLYSRVEVDYVCVALKHPMQWRDNQGYIRGKVASYAHAQGYGDMYFSTKGVNFGADELVAAIQSHVGGIRLSVPQSLVSDATA